ncbi:MAG TPA: hypothetical protein VFV43_12900 [Limnobacter sp.]|nr:hypothetical protein [Limnobacter sp.]
MKVSAFFQMWLVAVIGLSSVGNVQAIVLGPVHGKGVQGQPLKLSSKVSGLNDDQAGQLREVCLKARIRPFAGMEEYALELGKEPVPLRAQFVRLGPGVGEIFFDGPSPLGDLSLLLEVESHCPLATFEHKWTVFLDPAERASSANQNLVPESVNPKRQFDFGHSTLLAQSRQAPKPLMPAHQGGAPSIPKLNDKPESSPNLADGPSIDGPGEDALDSATERIELASAQAAMSDYPEASSDADWSVDTTMSNSLPLQQLGVVGSLVLSLSGLAFWGIRRRRLSARVHARVAPRTEPAVHPDGQAPLHASAENVESSVLELPQEDQGGTPLANRVLESFYTPDSAVASTFLLDHAPGAAVPEAILGGDEAIQRTLGALQRSSMAAWKLPESYSALVASRNSMIEAFNEQSLLLLQCQLGLVELAYQEASNGQTLRGAKSGELLEEVLGEDFATHLQSEWPTLPDIVRTYVRAKFCEISGAGRRKLFKENLVSLVDDPPAGKPCFDRSLWLELLAEQGVVDA